MKVIPTSNLIASGAQWESSAGGRCNYDVPFEVKGDVVYIPEFLILNWGAARLGSEMEDTSFKYCDKDIFKGTYQGYDFHIPENLPSGRYVYHYDDTQGDGIREWVTDAKGNIVRTND